MKSRRTVSLPETVVTALRSQPLRQLENPLALSDAYADQDLAFTSGRGDPLQPNTLVKRFKKRTAAAHLPSIRFHDMRQTSATLKMANGEHPKIVQERLGHADIGMTLNLYSHVTSDMQRDAAGRLDALIDEASYRGS